MIEVAAVLIRQGDEFVLQHRDDIPSIADPGMIGPWGGVVEPHDRSPKYAALRELQEETGVKVSIDKLQYLTTFDTTSQSPKTFGALQKVYIFLLILDQSVNVQCYEGLEIFRTSSIDEIPKEKRSEYLITSIRAYESFR
jgi:8-oxo-dGTP pyrophosphatase MutT (NUDIX family)